MQFIFLQVLIRRIKAIRFFMKDKSVPKRKKLLIVFGLVYLFLPFDLIPPFVPVFGFLDDLILWGFLIYYLRDELDRYWIGEKEVPPSKKYRGKRIINDVNFEIKENEGDVDDDS
ncbi:MAG: YkvA family protein [Anaerovoracaceae bacterium]|jgi:uncharacterized membrane protein YkvA (DUF1232 family)